MRFFLRSLFVIPGLCLMLTFPIATFGDGGGGSSSAPAKPVDPDITDAEKAIKDQDWGRAVDLYTSAASRDDKNADIHNMLGYAERKRGNLDTAFKHYERALALDPKHRGAHEYVGEAYLIAGNLTKAEEHLKTLDKLCFLSCEQYRDLKAAIAEYRQKHPK